MANVLADMVLRLGMDSAEIRKSLKTVETDLQKFTRDVRGLKGALEGAFAIAGLGYFANELKGIVLNGAKAADQMGKLAQSAGASVEDFSRLAYAARLADVETGDFATSLGILSKKIADAAAGGRSADIFARMGIAVKDAAGQIRPTAELLTDIAAKFQSYGDGAAKTALALELFGKSGARLIPFLNSGASGIAELTAEADRLGITIDAKTAAASEQLNDSLERMHMMSERLGASVASQLAPTVEALSNTFGDAAAKADLYNEVAGKIAFAVRAITGVALAADHSFERLGLRIAAWGAASAAALKGNFDEARTVVDLFKKDIDDLDRKYGARMDALGFTRGGGYNPPTPEAPSDMRRGHGYNYGSGHINGSAFAIPESGTSSADASAAEVKDAAKSMSDAAEALRNMMDKPDLSSTMRWIPASQNVPGRFAPFSDPGFSPNLDALNTSDKNPVVDAVLGNQKDMGKDLEKREKAVEEFAKQAQRRMTDLLGDQLGDMLLGKWKGGLEGMIQAWGEMLTRMLTMAVASGIMSAIFGGAGGFSGGFFGAFGGKRATGGPVAAGQTYLVGENGPELFRAPSSGFIVPNEKLGGGTVVHNWNVQTMDASSFRDFLRSQGKSGVLTTLRELAADGRI